MSVWHLYIVRCASGALYTGITINVKDRIAKHNVGKGAKSVVALGLLSSWCIKKRWVHTPKP